MNTTHIQTYALADLPSVAQKLKEQLKDSRVITFTGPLGAGKTTLIKELLRQCGVNETVVSPTFTYLNLYENEAGDTFYHFDLYRMGSQAEFQEAGFDECLYEPKSYALIEWPEHVLPLLSQGACHVAIDYHEDSSKRVMSIKYM